MKFYNHDEEFLDDAFLYSACMDEPTEWEEDPERADSYIDDEEF